MINSNWLPMRSKKLHSSKVTFARFHKPESNFPWNIFFYKYNDTNLYDKYLLKIPWKNYSFIINRLSSLWNFEHTLFRANVISIRIRNCLQIIIDLAYAPLWLQRSAGVHERFFPGFTTHILCTSGATRATVGEYIGKSFHRDGTRMAAINFWAGIM